MANALDTMSKTFGRFGINMAPVQRMSNVLKAPGTIPGFRPTSTIKSGQSAGLTRQGPVAAIRQAGKTATQLIAESRARMAASEKKYAASRAKSAATSGGSGGYGGYGGYSGGGSSSYAAPAAYSPVDLASQYAGMAGTAPSGPLFSEVMPFYKSWDKFQPMAEEEAASMVNPGIQRQQAQQMRDFGMGMARSGGGRFGRAQGQRGAIQAENTRQRKSQMLDWINQRKGEYKGLFYDPAEQAWNRGIEMGKTDQQLTTPTWDQFMGGVGQGGMDTSQFIT